MERQEKASTRCPAGWFGWSRELPRDLWNDAAYQVSCMRLCCAPPVCRQLDYDSAFSSSRLRRRSTRRRDRTSGSGQSRKSDYCPEEPRGNASYAATKENQAMNELPHLRLEETAKPEPYTHTGAGPIGQTFERPARNQPAHARKVRTELVRADADVKRRRAEDAEAHPELVEWQPEETLAALRRFASRVVLPSGHMKCCARL